MKDDKTLAKKTMFAALMSIFRYFVMFKTFVTSTLTSKPTFFTFAQHILSYLYSIRCSYVLNLKYIFYICYGIEEKEFIEVR